MISEHEGRFLRQTTSGGFIARVTIRVERPTFAPAIAIACSGAGFTSQGTLEEASAASYDDWKLGARAGIEYALRRAEIRDALVTVLKISGLSTDTNATIVAAAAAFALWDAVGYVPDADERQRIDDVVLASWSPMAPALPVFG